MPDIKTTALVTEPEYRKGEAVYLAAPNLECVRAPENEDALASAIRDSQSRYVIVGNRKYSGPLYDALPSGGVIARMASTSRARQQPSCFVRTLQACSINR